MSLSTMSTSCKLLLHDMLLGNQRDVFRFETQEKLQLLLESEDFKDALKTQRGILVITYVIFA